MTCIWKCLINLLGGNRIKNVLGYKVGNRRNWNPANFINALKLKNMKASDVTVNNSALDATQIDKNFHHIKELNSKTIVDNYVCSTSDPVLLT